MGFASEFFKLLARGAFYEKLIFNKEKENMSEKCFKGLIIPPLVDTPEGRKAVRRGHQSIKDYCFLSEVKCMVYECIGAERRCGTCIACLNRGDERRKREVFKEYDLRHPVEEKAGMPKLCCGTVVKMKNGQYFLIEGTAGEPASRTSGAIVDLISLGEAGGVTTTIRAPMPVDFAERGIDAIYADRNGDGFIYLGATDLARILQGDEKFLIWKRPDQVKEMTVDEISKALGCKVKVVGSEKADD
jgi:hypothetical protein